MTTTARHGTTTAIVSTVIVLSRTLPKTNAQQHCSLLLQQCHLFLNEKLTILYTCTRMVGAVENTTNFVALFVLFQCL